MYQPAWVGLFALLWIVLLVLQVKYFIEERRGFRWFYGMLALIAVVNAFVWIGRFIQSLDYVRQWSGV